MQVAIQCVSQQTMNIIAFDLQLTKYHLSIKFGKIWQNWQIVPNHQI